MNDREKALIEECLAYRTDENTPPEEVERIRGELTGRMQGLIDRCHKRTHEEWSEESLWLSYLPLPPYTPEKLARAREMAMRKMQIDSFLRGEGPEPEWPWAPKHSVSPEERKREIDDALGKWPGNRHGKEGG